MPRFCASCGAQMADSATFCPACGKASSSSPTVAAPAPAPVAAQPATAGGLADNVAGMLAYITIIPAILFLVLEPYNKRPFIRFHAFQCIFLGVGLMVLHIACWFVPVIGWGISMLVSLAGLIAWAVCLIKANQGEMYKLPVIGDLAEKQANA